MSLYTTDRESCIHLYFSMVMYYKVYTVENNVFSIERNMGSKLVAIFICNTQLR